jgi:hypothetical protein
MDSHACALFNELFCLPLIGEETILRAFCLSAIWQIYETLYLLLRVQECRFITPSQGARLIALSMRDGILTCLSFRFPDPTVWPPEGVPLSAKTYSLRDVVPEDQSQHLL